MTSIPVEQLWCLHVLGPDDVHPAPDRATAQLWATQWTVWNHQRNRSPDVFEPLMSWIVAPWPHDAESHAESLAKSIVENTFPVEHEHHLREQSRPMDREAVARIIGPIAFESWQASYDYSIAQGDTEGEAKQQADWSEKKSCDDALAKADAIIALIAAPPASEDREGYVLVPRDNLARIRQSMCLLQQNSEECARAHHGYAVWKPGEPGWLTDTRRDLEALTAMLAPFKQEDGGA